MSFNKRCLPQIIFLLILHQSLWGQLPQTYIYSLDLDVNENKVILDNVQFLTDFNPSGYNNQPHFIDDESLLITSNWKNEDQTDVWLLDLTKHDITRITATDAGEFSPTIQSDGMNFSVIRQTFTDENDPIQVLWSYPLERSHGGKPIILDPSTVGYHTWLASDKVALYLVGDPSELIIYDTKTKATEHVAYNVGRALKTSSKEDLIFIQKTGSTNHIRKYNLGTHRSTLLTTSIDGQEDFDVLPNDFLIAGQGSKLMIHRPMLDHGWKEIKDLSSLGIISISRIASSSNRIAIVTTQN
ncbi:MAG: hypothetical protein ACJA01_001125 [Saprospiraceae bacterium]|jgi:hypothetical protein